jgi:hypothetical protein
MGVGGSVCGYPDDWRDDWEDRWDDWQDGSDLDWTGSEEDLWEFLQDLWDAMHDDTQTGGGAGNSALAWFTYQFDSAPDWGDRIENTPTYIPPPFDKNQLLNDAANYNTYNQLNLELNTFDQNNNVSPNGSSVQPFNIIIQNGLGTARTSYIDYSYNATNNSIVGIYDKTILIDGETSIEKGLLSLAFEMSNATLSKEFDNLRSKAIRGNISKDDYVKLFMYTEAKSMLAKMDMADDMGILTTTFSPSYVGGYNRLRKGVQPSLSLNKFLNAIAHSDYTSSAVGPNGQTRKQIYEAQYNGFRQMGIQAGY